MNTPTAEIAQMRLCVRFFPDGPAGVWRRQARPTRAQAANYLRHVADQIEAGETDGTVADFADPRRAAAQFGFEAIH